MSLHEDLEKVCDQISDEDAVFNELFSGEHLQEKETNCKTSEGNIRVSGEGEDAFVHTRHESKNLSVGQVNPSDIRLDDGKIIISDAQSNVQLGDF